MMASVGVVALVVVDQVQAEGRSQKADLWQKCTRFHRSERVAYQGLVEQSAGGHQRLGEE